MRLPPRRILGVLAAAALVAALAAPALARSPIRPLPSEVPTPGPNTGVATKVVRGFLGGLTVRAPRSFKGLKVFPVTGRGNARLADVMTLDEALKAKALRVTEMDGGAQVNSLKLENTGSKPVFVMGGEILRGAKQDRMLQGDLLVPPKSGPLTVRAFCTEQGRWTEQTAQFQASEMSVPNSVRGVAKAEKAQGRVWDSIAQNQSRLKVAAPTSAAKDVYQDKQVQVDTKPYIDALQSLPKDHRDAVGVIVTYGKKLVAVDVFGDDTLLTKLYPKLLRSYVVDIVSGSWNGDRDEASARAILAAAGSAGWTPGETDGVGTAIEFKVGVVHGTSLIRDGSVLHADAFEADDTPRTSPNRPGRPNEPNQPYNAPNIEQRQDRR